MIWVSAPTFVIMTVLLRVDDSGGLGGVDCMVRVTPRADDGHGGRGRDLQVIEGRVFSRKCFDLDLDWIHDLSVLNRVGTFAQTV